MFWQVDTKSQPITLATVVMTMAFNYNNNYNKIDNKKISVSTNVQTDALSPKNLPKRPKLLV